MLEQQNQPVMYISRRLNAAEQGYSQTQKEALAIRWALRRLHKYPFGYHFTIVTDHRALAYIFANNSSASKTTTSMLQRRALEISAYDYSIQHKPGVRIPQADFLSRYSNFQPPSSEDSFFIHPLPFNRNITIAKTKVSFSSLLASLRNGWNNTTKKRFPDLYKKREELSITPDGVILYGERIVIPVSCRKAMLEHLHSGHIGRDKMKSLARLFCWWPTLNADIAAFVDDCQSCHGKPRCHSTWKPWPCTFQPMMRIHADYCGPFLGKYYALILEDSYSRYPEVFLTTSASGDFTTTALRKFFSREGIPQVLVTDNGTHFNASSLQEWLKQIGVTQLFTTPRHPKSNGLAERFV